MKGIDPDIIKAIIFFVVSIIVVVLIRIFFL